jgi:pyrroloquinoline quinone (PQQ) biosynthesis protein C
VSGTAFAEQIEDLVVTEWFRNPPTFLQAMASKPTIAIARSFVLEWTKFSRWFPRWVGAVMANCPEFDVLAFEVENLMSEVVRDPAAGTNHYELLMRLGAATGLDRQAVEGHQASPAALNAFEWWDRMARQPDWLLGFTAVNGLEILGDRNLPRRHGVGQGTGLAVDPWTATGLGDDALEFFRVSDEADAAHGNASVEIIARYTEPGREKEVLAVLRESIDYLRRMMGGLWDLAQQHELAPRRGDDGDGR